MSTDPFVAQLAALCRSERTRVKWVFVPTHAIGHTLGERLALEGTSWANVRFRTPFDLALETAAPFLVERGINPQGDDLGPPLVMRLLRDLPADAPRYFRTLPAHPAIGEALWSAIRELRLAGVGADGLPASAFENPDKHAELHALAAAYEFWLATERRADSASIYQEALTHLDACPVQSSDLRLELPNTLWSPLVRRFLDELPGTRIEAEVPRIPGLPPARRLAGLDQVEQDARSPLAFLMQPAARGNGDGPGEPALKLFRAGGKEAEIEEVFRRVLHAPGGALRLDTVEIACASPDYPLLVWEKAQRYGWPVTVAPGLPVLVSRPARALLAWCNWIEDGFPASGLRALFQSGDIRLDIADGPGSGQAADLLRRAEPTWGRGTYSRSLNLLAAAERERARDPEADADECGRRLRRAASAERLRNWIEKLLAPLPDPDIPRVGVQRLIQEAREFVDRVAATPSEVDGKSAAAIQAALTEMQALGDVALPTAEALELIRATVDGLTVASDRARPGHLHVSMLPRAGYAGRPRTFIVGLQEGQVFPPPLEDAVLLDAERRVIHPSLATSDDRIAEAVHAVVSRLAVLPSADEASGVCLSFSCRDLRDSRQTFPSWVMLQALRLLRPGAEVAYTELDAALGEPHSRVPAAPTAALDDAGWWLASLKLAGAAGVDRVLGAFPDLARGAKAEEERASVRFTMYDGYAPSAGPVLDPRQSGVPVSPTRLEAFAECPFRYLLEHGLGLEPIEEEEQDEDEWLDALMRGSLLHDLYAEMMRELRDRGQKADPGRHLTWLTARAEVALADLKKEMPPPSEDIFRRERDAIVRDLEFFLELEAEDAKRGATPIAFEVGFAARCDDPNLAAEPLSLREPVEIELPGLRFLLSGRIDRIDRSSDGAYEVIDYKAGSFYRPKYRKTFRNGRLLQHALYSLAGEQLLRKGGIARAKVAAGCYYFPSTKGGGERVRISRVDASNVASVLNNLFDLMRDGAFVGSAHDTKKKSKEDCKFCKFGAVCGGEEIAVPRAAAKVANSHNKALAAYRALQEEDYE